MDLRRRTDAIFTGLAHPYRREAITILAEENGPLTVDELAEAIAARPERPTSGEHHAGPVETLRIELFHNHLPKLSDAGLIDYDAEVYLVSPTSVTTQLTALVQIAYSIAEVM